MRKAIVFTLTAATFLLATLTPDWKSELRAQAGGCTAHSWIDQIPCDGYPLNSNYKGSSVHENQSVQ